MSENIEPEVVEEIDFKTKFMELSTLYMELNELNGKMIGQLNESNTQITRLLTDFESYKARVIREKAENDKIASLGMVKAIIPALEDFDRAIKHIDKDDNIEHIKSGINLVHKKIWKSLADKGLVVLVPIIGEVFDSEIHEAVTQIPAPSEELKGKVIDTAEPGYALSEKIIRFPKVIVGA